MSVSVDRDQALLDTVCSIADDTMSACPMIASERIHQTNPGLPLIAKDV